MKPALPQGTRDFGADTLRKRRYIIETIRSVFELYGFEPLETPSMENLETLMGKYGDEGDKLIFKILNNGLDNPSKRESAVKHFEHILAGHNSSQITERALRYDLTIPFARYMAMNAGRLTLPFKRYQIQPVWRADRPQKGRYREFMQCDADVAGTYSLVSDVELAEIYLDVYSKLKIDVEVKINNRKILHALAEAAGCVENLTSLTVAIDKLDKIGIGRVKEELAAAGIPAAGIETVEMYLAIEGSNPEKLKKLQIIAGSSETGRKGMEELQFILDYLDSSSVQKAKNAITLDFTLARGLNYYTGTIYEVKAKNASIGSIGGGGRYDDLTGLFGVPDMPGVGISFGLDRIYDVMEELELFPENMTERPEVLFFNLGEKESRHAYRLMQELRHHQVCCEIVYEKSKMDKQFKYAAKKNIGYAVIIGSKELEERTCVVKDLSKGEQETIRQTELSSYFNKIALRF